MTKKEKQSPEKTRVRKSYLLNAFVSSSNRVQEKQLLLPDGILTNSSSQYVRDFILERFQLLAVVSLPQCAFAHFGAGVKASVIFVRKRGNDEVANNEEVIFMAAPELIGYDATGRKTESQLDEIVEQYKKFLEDTTPFFV